MEKKLTILGQEECLIINLVRDLKGSMEEKDIQLQDLNIYHRYQNIHIEYSRMDNIEALKRAVFIQWYGAVEPRIYTGIGDLSKESEEISIKKLIELFESGNSDVEFRVMLRHYYSIGDWYFNAFQDINRIMELLNKTNDDLSINEIIIDTSKRGQISEYWSSITKTG